MEGWFFSNSQKGTALNELLFFVRSTLMQTCLQTLTVMTQEKKHLRTLILQFWRFIYQSSFAPLSAQIFINDFNWINNSNIRMYVLWNFV